MSTANGDGVTATVIEGESADTRSEAAFDTPTATQISPSSSSRISTECRPN